LAKYVELKAALAEVPAFFGLESGQIAGLAAFFR
jgi:hypothetical protein